MLEMKGTRRQIVQRWIDACERSPEHDKIEREVFERLFDLMMEQSSAFSEDEAFVVLNERFDSKHRLLTPNAEYYINVCRSTWFMLNLLAVEGIGIVSSTGLYLAGEVLSQIDPDNPVNGIAPPYFRHITEREKSCLMLEAFQNRKAGIDEKVLSCYNGECGHANLNCRFMERETGKCNRKVDDVKETLDELAEDHLLAPRRKKYYYKDIL